MAGPHRQLLSAAADVHVAATPLTQFRQHIRTRIEQLAQLQRQLLPEYARSQAVCRQLPPQIGRQPLLIGRIPDGVISRTIRRWHPHKGDLKDDGVRPKAHRRQGIRLLGAMLASGAQPHKVATAKTMEKRRAAIWSKLMPAKSGEGYSHRSR